MTRKKQQLPKLKDSDGATPPGDKQLPPRKSLEPERILTLLRTQAFDELIGVVEDDRVEAKSQPYHLEKERGQLELAKDVAGFAEQRGGVIIIGAQTEKSPTHLDDQITRVREIARTLVDRDRYHSIIGSWIYPIPEGIGIDFYPSKRDSERGLVAIFVPEQAADRKPFMIVRSVLDDDKKTDLVVGYVRRLRAGIEPTKPQDLQRLLRDGKRFDDLQQGLDSLTEQVRILAEKPVENALQPKDSLVPVISEADLKRRADAAASEASLNESTNESTLTLIATPLSKAEIRGLFGGRDAPVVKALDHPRELRPHGFNVGTGATSRIVGNQLRRAAMPGWDVLELWRDGVLIFVSNVAGALTWGIQAPTQWAALINPLALCEMVFLFVELSRQVYEHAIPPPEGAVYSISVKGLNFRGKPIGLREYLGLGANTGTAQTPEIHAELKWDKAEIDSGAIAFELVAEVFRSFGFTDDQIPYSSAREDRTMTIDEEKIIAAGNRPLG